MSPFQKSLNIESHGKNLFMPGFVKLFAERGQMLMLHERSQENKNSQKHEPESVIAMQEMLGDITVLSHNKETGLCENILCADFKFEQVSSDNFYLETVSDFNIEGKHREGWVQKLKADEIWYCFIDSQTAARVKFSALKRWLNELTPSKANQNVRVPRHLGYPQKTQSRQNQSTHPLGILTPAKEIPPEVLYETYRLEGARLAAISLDEYLKTIHEYSIIARRKRAEQRRADFRPSVVIPFASDRTVQGRAMPRAAASRA
jgi:hypothetical protein